MSAFQEKSPPISALKTCMLDLSQPIGKRTTAAFYLRTIGTIEAAEVIAEALRLPDSALMRHELAYILGQMQHKELCSTLSTILEDETDDGDVKRVKAASRAGASAVGKEPWHGARRRESACHACALAAPPCVPVAPAALRCPPPTCG